MYLESRSLTLAPFGAEPAEVDSEGELADPLMADGCARIAPESTAGLPKVVLRKAGAGEEVRFVERGDATGEVAGEGERVERRL